MKTALVSGVILRQQAVAQSTHELHRYFRNATEDQKPEARGTRFPDTRKAVYLAARIGEEHESIRDVVAHPGIAEPASLVTKRWHLTGTYSVVERRRTSPTNRITP